MADWQEAQRTLEVWVLNDVDYYDYFCRLAKECRQDRDYTALADAVHKTLRGAKAESTAWYARKDLSDRDLMHVSWLELAEMLLAE